MTTRYESFSHSNGERVIVPIPVPEGGGQACNTPQCLVLFSRSQQFTTSCKNYEG